MSSYNRFPTTVIENYEGSAISGWKDIVSKIQKEIPDKKYVLAIDTYPGVDDEEVLNAVNSLHPSLFINMEDLLYPEGKTDEMLKPWLTDDRTFGKMCFSDLSCFQDPDKVKQAVSSVENANGLIVIYGLGAASLTKPDRLVYLDMARWEIQLRYRAGMSNYHTHNSDEEILKKFKRGYFVEWRIADRHKRTLFNDIDYLIDTNKKNHPVMITGDMFREGLHEIVKQPFRLVPYFDAGVWGGQWMKKKFDLPAGEKNYAWSFDGVPEENSLLLQFGDTKVEVPAEDLVLYEPVRLLGEKNYARFGAEFPIRFDFLDTMHGQNLSLQVHPTTDYIHEQFGMAYTQNESYYILDADKDACVYLGTKTGTDPDEMIDALETSQKTGEPFDAEKYTNKIPAKRHDHFLIPAGTIHCSGADSVVLEISATPYIFTFKLYDWGRLGMDGKPRPINIEHGSHVINWDRNTEYVKDHLVDQFHVLEENDDYTVEKTGLHELEFIETYRYTIQTAVTIDLQNTVSMLNLVEGEEISITSDNNSFKPFTVHYAETFILPADLGEVTMKAVKGPVKIMRAFITDSQS